MKNEIELNKETKDKLKNPIYRLDYLKEYAYRNLEKNQNKIYNDFIKDYGDIEYDFSFISEEEKKINYEL
jgi:hypothetical protein